MTATTSTLVKPLRSQLENAVKTARDVAEKAALAQLATGDAKVPDYLSPDQKALRRRLRAHGQALGAQQPSAGRIQRVHPLR